MSSQEAPDNSMPSNNNHKRSRDDDSDDDVANTINTNTHGREAKRRRTNDDDEDDDDDAFMQHTLRSPGPEVFPPTSIDPSNEETLDDVEVELDDLETISEHEVEELEDSIGIFDLTNENAVVESLGIAEPATPEDIMESVETDYNDDDNNDDYYRHIGSWSEPSSQQMVDEDFPAAQPSLQPQPARPRPRRQHQRQQRMIRTARMPYYHLPEWNQKNCGKEYFRHALSDSSLDSDEEF